MKRIFIILLAALSSVSIYSQDSKETSNKEGWKLNGSAGINFAQTSFANWSTGGDNSIAGNALLNAGLNYKKGHWLWQNNLVLEYGLTSTEAGGMQKTSDRIDLGTQIGYTTDNRWYYSAMADFKTQFYKGYNYPNKNVFISNFMAPAYSNISVGIEYKPEDKFYSVYFSPLATKLTIVSDDSLSNQGAFGVDPGDKFRIELGTYLKAKMQKDIMENVKLSTDANFFTPYNNSFGNIDVEWNMLISMKINKFLNASLNTTLKYSDDVKYVDKEGITKGPRVQFKEVLGIGIGYNF